MVTEFLNTLERAGRRVFTDPNEAMFYVFVILFTIGLLAAYEYTRRHN